LLVLAAHMLPLGPKPLQLNGAAAAMGMSLFFSLSGFLIARTLLLDASVRDFLVRRAARILPLVYLYLLVFLAAGMVSTDRAAVLSGFVANYLHFGLGPGTSHLWSLCVEVQFYVAIALLVAAAGPRALWSVWPLCAAVTLWRISDGAVINIKTHLRVDEILAGACVATVLVGGSPRPIRAFALLAVVPLWVASSHPQAGALQYARPYAAAALLAVSVSLSTGPIRTVLCSAFLRYIAAISYALYVVHPATYLGWWNTGGVVEKYLLKRPISFAATFALAHLSTFHWERRWVAGAKAWLARQRTREALSREASAA
jgi:peptidoglycan/LPS O-acetylase OafA/YrhL